MHVGRYCNPTQSSCGCIRPRNVGKRSPMITAWCASGRQRPDPCGCGSSDEAPTPSPGPNPENRWSPSRKDLRCCPRQSSRACLLMKSRNRQPRHLNQTVAGVMARPRVHRQFMQFAPSSDGPQQRAAKAAGSTAHGHRARSGHRGVVIQFAISARATPCRTQRGRTGAAHARRGWQLQVWNQAHP